MAPPNPIRDALRTKTVAAPPGLRSELVTCKINGEDVVVELRQASMKRIEELQAYLEKHGNVAGLVEFLIECAYVPGEGIPVFEPADRAVLRNHPPNGWVMELARKAIEMTRPTESIEVAKND